jgi:energy-coupling factor transport system permease protein
MNAHASPQLDPRAWLVWGLAASLPALTGRNPFMLFVTLFCVVIVRMAIGRSTESGPSTAGLIKLAAVFVAIGVMFNVLTVHSGDRVLATIPESAPLIGGDVTLNAVVFGILGGVAVLSLVITGLTVTANLDWATVMRLLPDSLVSLGVAGSIAFTFFPQTIASFRELREARLIRGAPLRTPRDYATLAAPMLASGLDRAVTLSELLETRGLGGLTVTAVRSTRRSLAMAFGLSALCASAYLFAVGKLPEAGVVLLVAMLAAAYVVRTAPEVSVRRTRFRAPQWTARDSIVAGGAAISMLGVVFTLAWNPDAIRYEPYPTLDAPVVGLPLMVALLGLLTPAYVASTSS